MDSAVIEEIKQLREQVDGLGKRFSAIEGGSAQDSISERVQQSKPKKFISGELLYVAIMGVRGHGMKHVNNFLNLPDCYISHLCDVDLEVGNKAADYVLQVAGYRPKVVQDFRHALDDKRVDILSIAAPHHWHAPAAIWALQAGKHVYLEKPVSHTFLEGEAIIAAAKKYGKYVQAGTQLRSNNSLRAAAEFISKGGIGSCNLAQCITYKPRPSMVAGPQAVIPSDVNYDLWCGPAQNNAPNRAKLHYDWHWFWEFGNGALGNNGIHRIDAARIALGLRGFGTLAFSYGGRFGDPDSGETPNVQSSIHRFGKTWIFHDVVGLPKRAYRGVKNGIIFYGTNGLVIYQNGVASVAEPDGTVISTFPGSQENHYRNFVDAIIEDNAERLNGNLYDCHVSSGLCHLGNISYRLGAPVGDDEIASSLQQLGGPQEITMQLSRLRKNMEFNKCPDAQFKMGRMLSIDPKNGHILNDPEAAGLMGKTYRQGYGFGF